MSEATVALPDKVQACPGVAMENDEATLRAVTRQLEGDQQPSVRSEATLINAAITPELIEQYERDGAVLLKGVFSEAWVEKVRRGISKNLKKPSQYSEKLAVFSLIIFLV